jgi:hypothetical protein
VNIQETVLQYLADHPEARPAEVAEWVREQIPGAKTTAASVSSIKTRARFDSPTPPAPQAKHVVPGHAVRETLAAKGVDSVNTATEWAAVNGRMDGTPYFDPPGISFKDADEIALALGLPELWSTDWAEWALPVDLERLIARGELQFEELFTREDARPPLPGDRVVHLAGRRGVVDRHVGLAAQVSFDDGRCLVVPARKLRLLTT